MTSKKRKMRSLTIHEISAVDKAAQVPAALVLMKREGKTEKCGSDGYTRPQLTTEANGHVHILDDNGTGGETSWTRSEGEEYGHSHPWIRLLDGTLAIGMAEGHSHAIATAKSTGDTQMTDTNKNTDAALAEVQKRAERAESIVKLNAGERAHFDGLPAAEQDGFLQKSSAERAEVLRKSLESNREVYKSRSGQVYRTSDDPRLVAMAKESDENALKAAEALEKQALATFEKRAAAEVPHLPGTDTVKANILRKLEGVEGAAEFLKAAENAAKAAFVKSGTGNGGTVEQSTAQQLDTLVKAHAAAHKVSVAKATEAVLETPEGAALYKKMDDESLKR